MEKHPSSLAVLAEIFWAVAENLQRDLVVLQEYLRKAEEINSQLLNTSLNHSKIGFLSKF